MPKRFMDTSQDEPPRKKRSSHSEGPSVTIKPGEILTDITGKQWRLGSSIGTGGFGEIFLISDNICEEVPNDVQYACKVESHTNGPLFVEINCYLRVAKLQMISEWKSQHNLPEIGVPHYVASGSHASKNCKYRFMIIPRFDVDLEKIYQDKGCKFNIKTVLTISLQIIDSLEYIHSRGYVHSDIKASNILLRKNTSPAPGLTPEKANVNVLSRRNGLPLRACRLRTMHQIVKNLRPKAHHRRVMDENEAEERCTDNIKLPDQIYLLDYGLATKYLLTNGDHKPYCSDERKAHAGTLLFCSLDAHLGVQSRRSDLESLGYNIIHWLTANLPWKNDLDDAEAVQSRKKMCLGDLDNFLRSSFDEYPKFVFEYFAHLSNLCFHEKPNYNYYKTLLKKACAEYGYKFDARFDFDNSEGWGCKRRKDRDENLVKVQTNKLRRTPLKSNVRVKPLLRKAKNKKMSWSKILMDPENILKKQKRERKLTDSNDSNSGNGMNKLDLDRLNPTYAMVDVFMRIKQKKNNNAGHSSKNKGDSVPENIEGYTPAMMAVYTRKKEREEMEYNRMVVINNNNKSCSKNMNKVARKHKKQKPAAVKQSPPRRKTSSKSVPDATKQPARRSLKWTQSARSYRLRG